MSNCVEFVRLPHYARINSQNCFKNNVLDEQSVLENWRGRELAVSEQFFLYTNFNQLQILFVETPVGAAYADRAYELRENTIRF